MSDYVPGNEPYLLPGGQTGCMLLHGFSSMPEEMRPLGEYLAGRAFTVLGARLAGHATQPDDLKRVHWTDWLEDVNDGLAVLSKTCSRLVLIGQSLGGMVALTAAARMDIGAVVALSTPYGTSLAERISDWLAGLLNLTLPSPGARFPPDHPLYHRRELNYPAYPAVPARSLVESDRLASAMVASLPQVKAPVLLIHSRQDQFVRFSSMQSIYDHLGSTRKEMLAVEGMDHSLVMDARREEVFEVMVKFLSAVGL